jgi:hypothetical protein
MFGGGRPSDPKALARARDQNSKNKHQPPSINRDQSKNFPESQSRSAV